MNAVEFAKAVESAAPANRRIKADPFNRFSKTYDEVHVTFYNLPKSFRYESNVDEINNRISFVVSGFSKKADEDPPTGKVKVETHVRGHKFDKFRAKTATPEKIVSYIADYLAKQSQKEMSIQAISLGQKTPEEVFGPSGKAEEVETAAESEEGFEVPWDAEEPPTVAEGYKYAGLPKAHADVQKMIKAGYLDLGQVDPKFATPALAERIADNLGYIMLHKDGVAFIRDPESVVQKMKAQGTLPGLVAKSLAGTFYEESGYASEAEEMDRAQKLGVAGKAFESAKVTMQPVTGKTGKGYRLTMTPKPMAIKKAAGLKETPSQVESTGGGVFTDQQRAMLESLTEAEAKTPEELSAVFDALKPKQKIQVAYKAVMGTGTGDYLPMVVGRRSVSTKHGVESVSLLRGDGVKAGPLAKITLYKRGDRVSLALGNMATTLIGIRT